MVLWTSSYCSLNTVNSQKEKLVSFNEMNVPEEVEKILILFTSALEWASF